MLSRYTRSAMSAEQRGLRRFLPPAWTLVFPAVGLLGAAAYRALTADADAARWTLFRDGLLLPGLPVAGIVALVVLLGWNLEID